MCDNSKEKFLLYKGSLKTESNIVSGILTDELWEKASLTLQDSLKAFPEILLARSASNASSWKCSLSKLGDPLELFEKSISCPKCINTDTEYNGFFDFLKSSCKCEIPAMNYNKTNITIDKKQNNLFVKNLSSDNFSQESNSGGEQKSVFRTKTGKPNNLFPNSHLEFQKDSERSMLHEIQKPKTFDLDGKENLPEDEEKAHKSNVAKITFKTAKEQLLASNPAARRTLGASRKAQAKFVSPMLGATGDNKQETAQTSEITDERLKNIDPKMIELIESEIIDKGAPVGWNDIAGLELAKSVIQEAVVWPILRPDIFTGLRRPPKGILLFGPPGTGKTLIGKCIASQCNATFFSISASSLTSKWMGDGEKMVRALFAVARCQQPAVVFIDEIDSLLTQRSDSEHEATRRIKTEFLVQLDGAATGEDDRILIVGATNRPQELDEAARRRLVKRLYVPLPEIEAREQIISNLLQQARHELSAAAVREVAAQTAGYSGADMRSLCCEAAMGPVRALPLTSLATIDTDMVRPVCAQDFKNALQRVRPSVSQDDLGVYVKWNKTYGQGF